MVSKMSQKIRSLNRSVWIVTIWVQTTSSRNGFQRRFCNVRQWTRFISKWVSFHEWFVSIDSFVRNETTNQAHRGTQVNCKTVLMLNAFLALLIDCFQSSCDHVHHFSPQYICLFSLTRWHDFRFFSEEKLVPSCFRWSPVKDLKTPKKQWR